MFSEIGNEAEFPATINMINERPRKDNSFLLSGNNRQGVIQFPSLFSSPLVKDNSSGSVYSSEHNQYLQVYPKSKQSSEQQHLKRNWGLSLNERVTGTRIAPILDENLPSFDLFGSNDAPVSTVSYYTLNYQNCH